MDVATEKAEIVPGFLASPARPQSRIGGFRSRPLSGLPGLTHATSISASEMRTSFGVDATTSPTGMPSSEPAVSRSAFPDSLSSIGLPGEEAATFEPLMIEPYEPSASIPSPAAAAGALVASPDPPLSPLTPPTTMPAPSASCPSPVAAAAAASAAAAPASPAIQPKPPPGSALKRFASSRRSLVRQTSPVSGGAATAAGCGRSSGVCAVASSVAEDGGKAAAAAAVTAAAAPAAAAAAAAAAAGGGGSAVPTAPRTPLPAVTDAPLIPPSPALSIAEVPVVVFDPTALPALPAAAAAAAGADGKATSSFLDPSKPAVRRLLPPLLRASQVLHDGGGSADVSPTGVDEGSMDGSSWPLTASRCGGGSAVGGGCGAISPAGGATGPDGWTELQDGLSAASPSTEPPLAIPSLLCVDIHDTVASPRGGRRALPPMDPLRISVTVASLSAASTSEAAEAESPGELVTMTSDSSHTAASPGHGDVTAVHRRGPSPRALPWDAAGEATTSEQRSWVGDISEAGVYQAAGDGRGVPLDGYGSSVVMHRTASFHAVSSGSSCGGGSGSSSNGHAANNQPLFDGARLRTRSAVMIPDLPMGSLAGLAGICGGGSSGGGGGGGSGGSGGAAAGRESGRLSRANSVRVASPRAATTAAATTAAAAALPPIVDRSGIDRRQTFTS